MAGAFAPESHTALLDRARTYAASVDVPVDLDRVSWEVSTRAKRRAGACLYDRETGAVTVRLAWRAAEEYDWPAFAAVLRHELIHAWEFQQFGEAGHGPRFRERAADLDVSTTCPTFADARLRLRCTAHGCAWTADRHRASAAVTDPEHRRCGSCGSHYEVEHVASGERWRTDAGYCRTRERIEEW